MLPSTKFVLMLLAAIPFIATAGGQAPASDSAATTHPAAANARAAAPAPWSPRPGRAAPAVRIADVYACRERCLARYDRCKTRCLDLYGDSPQGHGCISSCDLDLTYCRKRCR